MIGLNEEEQLTDTDTVSSPTKTIRKQESTPKKIRFSKKRIGPYSYLLKDVIGCGFSSVVYKGIKNDDKTQKVALKVIQRTHLSEHRRHLLSNQIKLMKKLNHPNIVKFLDVYETVNNCYIVTEFCEGGPLQKLIDAKHNINAGTVIQQIGNACQYMAGMNIIHRDLKPANIYLKNNVWKLGDFGFCQQLLDCNDYIKQNYTIGSPIFMSPQSLESKIYSSKCDSFALGVSIFYLLTGFYPWPYLDQKNLIYRIFNSLPNQDYLNLFPPKIKYYVLALLHPSLKERIHLVDCDFQAFSHLKKIKKIQQQLTSLKPHYQEHLNLIKFVYHLLQNYKQHQTLHQDLKVFMQIHLSKMIGMVQWHSQQDKNQIIQEYNISELSLTFENQDCYYLNNCLKDVITLLKDKHQSCYKVLLYKLLLYQQIVELLLHNSIEEILTCIRQLPLDADFTVLTPNHQLINQMLCRIDFYQL